MQVTKKTLAPTKVELTLVADQAQLTSIKKETLATLSKEVRVEGFRSGKAPLGIVEKHIDPTKLQAEFLETALGRIYAIGAQQEKLRPIAQPEVQIKKFVPFSQLEFTATVEVIGEVTLPDYKKMRVTKPKAEATDKDVEEVLNELKIREAEKKDVDRAAKNKDQVWIDFSGVDAKTKEPIKGADGKDYPLALGSNTFIPGFEENLVGAKPGEKREFTLTFPKDYGVKALQNRKVVFTTTVNKVQEVVEPAIDDDFAAKVGPFKNVAELKSDIKKEMQARKQHEADQKYADDVVTKIAEKTKIDIPQALIDEQIDRIIADQKQNLAYRGLTWKEFLEQEGLDESGYRKKQQAAAQLRVKAGLILAEIAELEKVEVGREEIEAKIAVLKNQYPDAKMQAQLDLPETRRDIASRIMTDKTLEKLLAYAAA